MMRSPIGFVVLCVTCLSAAFAAEDKGEVKKPLSYWIERLASDQDETRAAANEALQAYGDWLSEPPNFFPAGNPWAERDQIRDELRPQLAVLKALLNGKDDDCRGTAAMLLGVIGTDARSSTPALLKILRSKETKETSATLMMTAVVALLHVTPPDTPVGPELLEAYFAAGGRKARVEGLKLDNDDGLDVRGSGIFAVYVVLVLASSDRTMIEVPTLVELAGPRFPRSYRATAISALAELEGDANAAIPGLRKLLADKDRQIGQGAGLALLHINGNLQELPAVVAALQLDENDRAKFEKSISESLETIEHDRKQMQNMGAEMVPSAVAQLKYGNRFFQRQAIRALAEIGPAANGAIPELTAAAKSHDPATQDAAVAALKKIEFGTGHTNE